MVEGLGKFADHFEYYTNNYMLIGGTACDLAMQLVGQSFRATKDLDIVLFLDQRRDEFVSHFWEFVRAGGYLTRQQANGRPQYYRFTNPARNDYPFMLELFSALPSDVNYLGDGHLTPIPVSAADSRRPSLPACHSGKNKSGHGAVRRDHASGAARLEEPWGKRLDKGRITRSTSRNVPKISLSPLFGPQNCQEDSACDAGWHHRRSLGSDLGDAHVRTRIVGTRMVRIHLHHPSAACLKAAGLVWQCNHWIEFGQNADCR